MVQTFSNDSKTDEKDIKNSCKYSDGHWIARWWKPVSD